MATTRAIAQNITQLLDQLTSIDGQQLVNSNTGDPMLTDNYETAPTRRNHYLGGSILDPEPPQGEDPLPIAVHLTAGSHTVTLTVQPLQTHAGQTMPAAYVISTDYLRLTWLNP